MSKRKNSHLRRERHTPPADPRELAAAAEPDPRQYDWLSGPPDDDGAADQAFDAGRERAVFGRGRGR